MRGKWRKKPQFRQMLVLEMRGWMLFAEMMLKCSSEPRLTSAVQEPNASGGVSSLGEKSVWLSVVLNYLNKNVNSRTTAIERTNRNFKYLPNFGPKGWGNSEGWGIRVIVSKTDSKQEYGISRQRTASERDERRTFFSHKLLTRCQVRSAE